MARCIGYSGRQTVVLLRAFMIDYVELHARSAFSFLRAASLPEQLMGKAAELAMPAIALCDRDGVYGAPRFFARGKETGVRPIVGAELTMEDKTVLPVLVESRIGYQNLCQLLTRSHLRNEKGKAAARWSELPKFAEGLVAMTGDEEGPLVRAIVNGQKAPDVLRKLRDIFGPGNLFVEIQRHRIRGEERVLRAQMELADQLQLPLLATNGVLHAAESERVLLDVFTCIRHHTHLDAAGKLLSQNGERHLKTAVQMLELFHDCPGAVRNSVRLADRLNFGLENLGYEFPRYEVPEGHTMDSFLREQAFAGARRRYGEIPEKVRAQLETELALIQKLKVSGYFLIVWDIAQFCREQNIMAQGRGSAANSTVCFCLGITAVDPLKFHTLFERFLTEGRKDSWPDIDIDLPSGDRRERVIQEIYRRYGQHGAAMTANVITYRGRSSAREVGKALNLAPDVLNRFSSLFANGDFPHTMDLRQQMEKAGLPVEHPRARPFVLLCQAIRGLPRHLGQHSGGMIISRGKLNSIVPLENASMPNRVVAQWDKDDCEDLGIIKVDFLGLGMMSVLQDAVELARQRGRPLELNGLPPDDPKTFEMMRNADTIGVFQIESRAQMATLPRMKPKIFYDLVIEVAIIRPGPIQGHLMHPYLARRAGKEEITYYHDDLKPVLARTLGVPLFQEQMLQMAMVMSDFSGAEAEELRRALSFHRSQERMERVEAKLRAAMQRKGCSEKIISEVAAAVSSFALYGFPESHAISFAHLAYASACYKAHRAPEFFASLLNNQPMGFYSSASLIKDGHRHGLKFLPVCVARSDWNCSLEPDDSIRLGLCVVKNLSANHAQEILLERNQSAFTSLEDFKRRVHLNKDELRTLAEVGALNGFAAHRRDALWGVESELRDNDLFGKAEAVKHQPSPLPAMNYAERIQADFNGMHLTTGKHPMALLRPKLRNVLSAAQLADVKDGSRVRIAGNVICRQRPGTAKGFVFISLEDETGISNAIVAPPVFEANRLVITEEPFLIITGRLQRRDGVVHIKAERFERLDAGSLAASQSHDFH
jgi:error-prone DNA polymerase